MATDPATIPAQLVFRGTRQPHDGIQQLPEAPPWRRFDATSRVDRGAKHVATPEEVRAVNAAIYLRRPLLITGKPGTGKTSLAYAVAHELRLGGVFVWPITSRSTLQQGMYHYDAIARLHDASLADTSIADAKGDKSPLAPADIGRYVRLGPLGAALASSAKGKPRVLLVDEIDKSDIDLPNDLLHIFEEGEFEIHELARLPDDAAHRVVRVGLPRGEGPVDIERGRVHCREFPIVFLTSNGEREFPPAFLRRCIRLDVPPPTVAGLAEIVRNRLGVDTADPTIASLIHDFAEHRDQHRHQLATDQLLNAVALVVGGVMNHGDDDLGRLVLRDLADTGS